MGDDMMRMDRFSIAILAGLLVAGGPGATAQPAPAPEVSAAAAPAAAPEPAAAAPDAGLRVHVLSEFGSTATPAETEATYRRALDALTADNGGILIVPEGVPTGANLENVARWSHSLDPTTSSLREWTVGPGVLVVDNREGNFTLRVPQCGKSNNAGITLNRTMRLPPGDSLTHWTEESVLNIENQVVHGSVNYMEWIIAPVKAGPDARFYVPTVRNLFKGMFLNLHQGPGYGGQVARATVKDIGYDAAKKMHYFTALTPHDHVAGAIVQNKSHVPAMRIVNHMNAANQTFFVYNHLNQYANGDSYLFEATFDYMGNVHSMPGDENGNCYAALIHSLLNPFRGTVKAMDAGAGRLVFTGGQDAHTLANSRPLINLDPEKWVTAGTVVVVPPNRPEAPYDTLDERRWVYDGRSYPSRIEKNPVTGVTELIVGGLIRGDTNCPWDASLVGRFFAIDDPTEYVTGHGVKPTLRRWYEIASVTVHADGTKDLQVKRYWWGAKDWNSITLYDPRNYSRDGSVTPLPYIIAPGAYVNDVSDAVGRPGLSSGKPPFTVGLTPSADTGSDRDFAEGDPIEQAIGADPFKPQGLRLWSFDQVPGAWPSSLIDLANFGHTARATAIAVRGGPTTLEGCESRRERRPAFDTVISIDGASTVGLECNADFANAALLFRQPNHEQPMKWLYDQKDGAPAREAVLTVSRDAGVFSFAGGGVRVEGAVQADGLTGDGTPARNLRGKNVPVPAGAKELAVAFPRPEADGDYAVFVEQSWLANRAVVEQTAVGFRVAFDQVAPEGAKLHWMIVR
jgi:hypothetical protein